MVSPIFQQIVYRLLIGFYNWKFSSSPMHFQFISSNVWKSWTAAPNISSGPNLDKLMIFHYLNDHCIVQSLFRLNYFSWFFIIVTGYLGYIYFTKKNPLKNISIPHENLNISLNPEVSSFLIINTLIFHAQTKKGGKKEKDKGLYTLYL